MKGLSLTIAELMQRAEEAEKACLDALDYERAWTINDPETEGSNGEPFTVDPYVVAPVVRMFVQWIRECADAAH
jgi:hypothetical protein